MRTIIAGSRTDAGRRQEIWARLDSHHLITPITQVICGMARGVDTIGRDWAFAQDDIPVLEMPADWDRYGKRAGYRRNIEMARLAEQAIIFWDGQSRGSKHMFDIALEHRLTLHLHIL